MFRPRSGFCPANLCFDPMTMLAVAGMAYSGISAYQQGQDQKKQYEEQAQIAKDEANTQAAQKETERRKTLANQRMSYLANGVSVSGTPLIVGAETSEQYQMEIDALRKSGVNQFNSLNKQGEMAATSGRTKLITSLLGAGSTGLKGSKARLTTNSTGASSSSYDSYMGLDFLN